MRPARLSLRPGAWLGPALLLLIAGPLMPAPTPGEPKDPSPLAAVQPPSGAGDVPSSEPLPPRPAEALRARLQAADQLAVHNPKEALTAVERALADARQSKDAPGVAWTLQRRGLLLVQLKLESQAVTAFEAAALAWRRAGDGPSEAAMLFLAGAYQPPGQSHVAHRFFQQALAVVRDETRRPLAAAEALKSWGHILHNQGDVGLAVAFWEAAFILEEKLTPGSEALAKRLNAIGVAAYREEHLSLAVELFQRALAIRRKLPPNSLAVAGLLDNLGLVATRQNDLEAAAEYHRQALALYEKEAPDSLDMAFCLNNLGNVAHRQGEWPAAKRYYERSLKLKEKHAPDSLSVAGGLGNLGAIALEQGDLKEAAVYLHRSLALAERLAPDSLLVAGRLHDLGVLEQRQGNQIEAERLYRRALAIEERLAPYSLSLAQSLHDLALLAAERRDWATAERLAARAWSLVRRQAAAVSGDEALRAFGASNLSYAADLARIRIERGKTAAAFQTVEEGRSQALLRILSERRLDLREAPASLQAVYRAAVATRDQAEQELSGASSAETLARRALAAAREQQAPAATLQRLQAEQEDASHRRDEARSAATRARLEVDRLWADLKRHSPRTFLPPLTLKQAVRALPPETLFVSYSVGPRHALLFLLRAAPNGEPQLQAFHLPTPVAVLETRVKAFLDAVTDPLAGKAAAGRSGRSLFTALVPPAARPPLLRANRLLISPDGPLWSVPFAALVVNASGPPRYLGATRPITLTNSLHLFAYTGSHRSRRRPAPAAPALVVGNPDFGPRLPRLTAAASGDPVTRISPSLPWPGRRPPPPLPATAAEGRQIAALYRGTLLLGRQASEAAVRRRIEQAAIIHLATHGVLHPARAMASGLLLAAPAPASRAGNSADDGLLQAWEIYSQLKLKAELVVLSACDTGRGQTVRGEGIVGLTRALQYAGARSIVASQWAVADRSTAKLMVAFHRKLRQGLPKDEALRQAMAVLRADPRTAHPYYWSPCFLTGDPDNQVLGVTGPP